MRNLIRISFFFLIGSLFFTSYTFAQKKPKPEDFGIKSKKALNLYFEAKQFDQYRMREKAVETYLAAIELEPGFAHANYEVGKNYYVRQQFKDALPYLQEAAKAQNEQFVALNFLLGQCLFYSEQYEEALQPLTDFLNANVGRKKDLETAQYTVKQAAYASEAIQDPVPFEPVNLGPNVNSSGDESQPFLTADQQLLLFTGRRTESTQGFNEDVYTSTWDGEKWLPTQNVGYPINTRENQGAATITQDGQTIIFVSCNLPGGMGNCDLYIAQRTKDGWSQPQNMGPNINSRNWESDPQLSDDGKTLFFTSSRPNGIGGRDIWYSVKQNGRWQPAQNMGEPINTVGQEISPFLHPDGESFYFASNDHPGFGFMDLFVTYKTDEGWSEPQNLGYPINTATDEDNIFISPDGRKAYYNSDREGGLGGDDLYVFDLPPRVRPKIATFLRGRVVDSLTEKPLAARIRLIDVVSGDTIRQVITERGEGKFLATLPLEKEYAAFVEAKGYLFSSKNFYLKNLEEEAYFDLLIEMVPLTEGKQVVLKNIFFEFNEAKLKETSRTELDFLANYMRQNPQMRIEIQGHTDDVGTPKYNLDLSQRRAESVRAFLIELGITDSRIDAVGYGETRPVSGNITEEDRAQNRRTEFKILQMK
ncbi:MAG: OmpA family protein [Bacteroidota bacterium]